MALFKKMFFPFKSSSRAQFLFNASSSKAEQLSNQIKTWLDLPEMDIPEFIQIDQSMQTLWLQYCLPYTACLMFGAQLKKNANFARTAEFSVIYGQLIQLMTSLDKQNSVDMGFADKFDQKRSEEIAQNEMGEVEDALLHYIDSVPKNTPYPESLLLSYLTKKIGVPEAARSQFLVQLQLFTFETMNEFSKI